MKRLPIILVILLAFCNTAFAEAPLKMKTESWRCGACGTVCTGDFCENDATPRPLAEWETHWTCPACRSVNAGAFCENDATPRTPACSFEKGDVVTFGRYPVTVEGTDRTPIEWIVVKNVGPQLMLVSRYVLDTVPYEEAHREQVTYEKSSVREWLNGSFADTAFTEEEQAFLVRKELGNGYGTGYSKWRSDPGEATRDKAFLLSYQEAVSAFGISYGIRTESACAAPTEYVSEKGVFERLTEDGNYAAEWWLRSPGREEGEAMVIDNDGGIGRSYVFHDRIGIRPAVWVYTEAAY